MKKTSVAVFALSAALSVNGFAQSATTNAGASASSNTSVSASQSGASAQTNTSVSASGEAQVAPSEHSKHDAKHSSQHHSKADAKSATAGNASAALAAGTTVNAVLSKPLDSKSCKPGDQVFAKATEDVKSEGKVIIPKGSKLIGHVTEAKTRAKGETNSTLGIAFDRAILKNGQQAEMNSVVQAIAAAQANAAGLEADSMMNSSTSMATQSAGSVGSTGGGLVSAVGSTAGAATGTLTNVGGNATSTLGSTANVAGNVAGSTTAIGSTLNSSSTGVVGLKNLSLASNLANSTNASVINSTGKSVRLDSGTQMMLRVVGSKQ